MPKKKKVENAESESKLTYTGQVTIEKVRANKVVKKTVIKNTGCLPLFNFLAECLTLATPENAQAIGLFNDKPQYLNCFYKSSENIISSGVDFGKQQVKSYMKQSGVSISSSADITKAPNQQGDAFYAVNIKFLLQDNNFAVFNTEESSKINILALYGARNVGTQDLPHAYIIIPNASNYLTYQEGVNYIITWTLKLSNK